MGVVLARSADDTPLRCLQAQRWFEAGQHEVDTQFAVKLNGEACWAAPGEPSSPPHVCRRLIATDAAAAAQAGCVPAVPAVWATVARSWPCCGACGPPRACWLA